MKSKEKEGHSHPEFGKDRALQKSEKRKIDHQKRSETKPKKKVKKKKNPFQKAVKRRVKRYGKSHDLPDWAEKGLLVKMEEDRRRRQFEKQRRQQLLARVPEAQVVMGEVKYTGDEIYPIVRRSEKSESHRSQKQNSVVMMPKSSSQPKLTILSQESSQRSNYWPSSERSKRSVLEMSEHSITEKSSNSSATISSTSCSSASVSPTSVSPVCQTTSLDLLAAAPPSPESATDIQVQVQPVPVSSKAVSGDNLWTMLHKDSHRSASVSDATETVWDPFDSLERLRTHDHLFTDAATEENTVMSIALLSPAPTDPKPLPRKTKRKTQVTFDKKRPTIHQYLCKRARRRSIFDFLPIHLKKRY